ncbi:MAG: class I SAM-dependent methyltransferase [Pseudomonadales bacterium]
MAAPRKAGWSVPLLGPQHYARWRASALGEVTEALEQGLLLELLGDVSGQRVLEIGCGDGAFAATLSGRGARVVALDASAAMLDAARARGVHEMLLCQGCAERLPFARDSFDVVVASTILCFVQAAEQTFAEIGRVLRPGGRVVIGELGRWSTWALARRVRGWLGSPLWRHGRFRTPRELRRLAAAGGLETRTVRGAVFYPRVAFAARLLQRLDPWLGRRITAGAAFLVLVAVKPPAAERVSASVAG